MADDLDDDKRPGEDPILTTARQCYALGVAAIESQLTREKDDLRCQVPELMWPDDVQTQRKGQIIGNITLPPRPMISIPSLDQPVQLVLNQEKAAHLGVQIHALSEDADDDTAEVLQGLYRRIEVDSRAGLARSWAYERAVKAGRGAYRVVTEYADDGGHWTDQKIVIKRILNQESVVLDPTAQEPDWSDGKWGFIRQWVKWTDYKRDYKDSRLAKDFSENTDDFFGDLGDDERPKWVTGEGEGKAVLVVEYFYLEFTEKTRVVFADGSDGYEDEAKGRTIGKDARKRSEQVPHLKWVKLNGAEIIESRDMDGRFIPIIPVIGKELQPFDDERRWMGIYGPNKEAARMLNYAASGAIEMAALETKAPYLMAEGQQEGHEREFLQANVRNFPYLLYKPTSLNGQPVPPPQRVQVDTSRLGPSMMLLSMAREFIQSGTGAFRETLGQADPSNKTKGGILALQDQHTRGNSHFLDNLAQISITYEAKVVLDLIPFVYDRPGRIVRLLDMEDNARTVMLNKPFVKGQNGRPQPTPETPDIDAQVADPKSPVTRYDLKRGQYGVAVSVGKARESRIEEGSDGLSLLFQANPGLFQLYGDLWLKFQSWPGHEEAAERAKKMLPPQLQKPDEEDDPAKAAQELAQLKQAAQQMQEQLQQATQALATDQAKQQAQMQIAQLKAQSDAQQTQADLQAKIQIAQIDAQTKLQIAQQQSDLDADRELALQVMKNAATIAVAHITAASKGAAIQAHAAEEAQALGQNAAQSDAARQHDLEMADRGHAQSLEAAEQQAALQPPPSNGSGAA